MDSKLDWRPDQFKKALLGDLQPNAEIVGEFVRRDAQKRLRGFPELDTMVDGKRYTGGGGYRAYVANLIGWEVVVDKRGLVINVGVRPGRGGRHHGLYIELGSKSAPARPFLRPSVFENAAKIVTLLAGK